MNEINALLSETGRQPILEMQLRQLAQRFGFTHINAEQSLELLKNLMNSKGFQSKIALLSANVDQEQNKKPEPIRPINAPSHFIPVKGMRNGQFSSVLSLLPNELRKKFVVESKNLFG
ncbi:hypothetical protein LOAG_03977 [Loa loa]|uniref:Uncharacterized protein n=1 Tax=Loa loa TaxID=7209 RepID=A0A1S0U354_LOALO|nr:hypothetical protein LOAG_03977 [Loa loa]EFO24507.1 hypothetical protein LOAG_03977 [Loa loa]